MPLRLRLALIYGFLAIVTLVLALLLGYGFYERAAYRNADGLLAVIVTQAQLELEQTGFGAGLKPPPLLPITLRLYDEVGVLRSSAGENNVPEIDLRAFLGNQGVAAHAPWIRLLPRVSPTAQTFDGFGLVNVDGVRWRSLTLRVGTGFLQGVASLAPYDAVLKTVQRTFVLIGLAGALLLALLGYLLSKASLFPLEQRPCYCALTAPYRQPQAQSRRQGTKPLGGRVKYRF